MTKTPRLSVSGIEYLDYVWNFFSGCHNWQNGVCPVGKNCWAKKLTERFKSHYPNGFEPTFYPEAFLSPLYLKKPARIGVCFMGDLFGDWVDPWMEVVFRNEGGYIVYEGSLRDHVFMTIESCPQHTFLFLTKCPQNLIKWSPFPKNCQVGVSACNQTQSDSALQYLLNVEAKVKFLSY